ncbi:hypothetical protein [Nocardia sp. NPDC051832]|uniref:hypothetical protein n=1 Tax=Nocardia sp. NPDC051832 TaxID=3155673 RepID=UPI0034325A37
MKKFSAFVIAGAAAAGILFGGAGVAGAEEETPVDTGSAKLLTALITGSAGAKTDPADTAEPETGGTGSASKELIEALTKLITGSSATKPAPTE